MTKKKSGEDSPKEPKESNDEKIVDFKKALIKEGEGLFKNAQFANTMNQMKANFKTYIEQILMLNKLRKIKYDSLLKEGFKEDFAKKIILEVDLFK